MSGSAMAFSGTGARRSRCLPGTLIGCAAMTLMVIGLGAARSARGNGVPLVELARIDFATSTVAPAVEPPTSSASHESNEAAVEEPTRSVNADTEMRWFDGRPIRPVGIRRMVVTAYSPDERSCGEFADGITASGFSVFTNGMKLVAADTSILPFGSLVSVPGYDDARVVPVLDRGGLIKGNRLDVLYPTHEAALRWGVQELDVVIWEYVNSPALASQ